MPVNANFFERLLLFRLNKGPAPMLDLFGAGGFEAVCLALDMGVFEALAADSGGAGKWTDGSALADAVGADEDGLAALLGFLEAQGYVVEDAGRYRNTKMTTRWLTSGGEANLGPWFTFWNELVFPFWERHLETVVREGEPPLTMYEWFDEEPSRWALAQRGFRAAASVLDEEVAKKVTVPDDASRLLDVGGGHGRYALALCRRHPSLVATVFDHPDAVALAREEAADAGLSERVETRGGDYWEDDLGTDYDLALVFNVIHAHDAEANARLFERVGDALDPGGRIVVLDQLAGSASSPVGAAGLRFVGLTYATTLGGTIHAYEAVADWLRAAGFEDVQRTSIRRAGPGNALVEARKS